MHAWRGKKERKGPERSFLLMETYIPERTHTDTDWDVQFRGR